VLFFKVTHPDFPQWSLTLVVGRRKGLEPIYLLTNEEITTAEDAWKVVFAYIRRWRIEMSFRHLKSDMAVESIRVYAWEDRLQLLGLLALAYGFLMELMRKDLRQARDWLLRLACHRRGRRMLRLSRSLSVACVWPSPSFGWLFLAGLSAEGS
jgi:hypothetical protein